MIPRELQSKVRTQRSSGNPPLPEWMEKRLVLYALAASAGLLMGTATPAEARVRFTRNTSVLSGNTSLAVDLNNDGTVDFTLINTTYRTGGTRAAFLTAKGAVAGNEVEATPGYYMAVAFNSRSVVSGSSPFLVFRSQAPMVANIGPHGGEFSNVTDRFLGVKFMINGAVHFGWIGFRSVVSNKTMGDRAKLFGWAYETRPNTPIETLIPGDDLESFSVAPGLEAQPNSLELLARGNVAITDWRRRRGATA
jgi:hypothetical protein